jgi:hypothetical protein
MDKLSTRLVFPINVLITHKRKNTPFTNIWNFSVKRCAALGSSFLNASAKPPGKTYSSKICIAAAIGNATNIQLSMSFYPVSLAID